MNVNRSVVDEKVITAESVVDCRIQAFNYVIDFYGEESNGWDTSL